MTVRVNEIPFQGNFIALTGSPSGLNSSAIHGLLRTTIMLATLS